MEFIGTLQNSGFGLLKVSSSIPAPPSYTVRPPPIPHKRDPRTLMRGPLEGVGLFFGLGLEDDHFPTFWILYRGPLGAPTLGSCWLLQGGLEMSTYGLGVCACVSVCKYMYGMYGLYGMVCMDGR